MLADPPSPAQELMEGKQLYQGVGQQDHRRDKKMVKISKKADSLHWLGLQEQRSFPINEEEYCLSEVGEEQEGEGEDGHVGGEGVGAGRGEEQ